jgi:hypothetical protein
MKVKSTPIFANDELHIDKVSTRKGLVQVRVGPESGNYAKGSRTVWLTYRQARAFAYALLAETELLIEKEEKTSN